MPNPYPSCGGRPGEPTVCNRCACICGVSSFPVANAAAQVCMPYVNRISGALLVVVGGYVGYYGLYEIRLFTGNGSPEDPVIAAAGRLQGAIAGWVHQHGAWPWLVALALLLLAAISLRARYRRAGRATAGDES